MPKRSILTIAILIALSTIIAVAKPLEPNPDHFIVPMLKWKVHWLGLFLFGLVGQCLFFARMAVQAWASKRAGESVVPPEFWLLSFVASVILLIYFYVRSDPVMVWQQALMLAIYLRNLYLLFRKRFSKEIRRPAAKIILVVFPLIIGTIIWAISVDGQYQSPNVPNPTDMTIPFTGMSLPVFPVLVFGFVGSVIFSGRFLVQWYASERARKSVVPSSFWWMALVGSVMLLLYLIIRSDPVGVLGQLTGAPVYAYNLILIARKKRAKAPPIEPHSAEK